MKKSLRPLLLAGLLLLIVTLLAIGAGARGSSALQPPATPSARLSPTDSPSETPVPTPALLIGSTTEVTIMSFVLVLLVIIPVAVFWNSWAEKRKKK